MPVKLRTEQPDEVLKQIVQALKKYNAAHPRAKIEAYRWNSVSVRIRVISSEFKGTRRADREDDLWPILTTSRYKAKLLHPVPGTHSLAFYRVIEY